MPSKRIIACLDVKDGFVVKGIKFKNHVVLGDAIEFAKKYSDEGVDELVFYDITASIENRSVDPEFVKRISRVLNIPFCVAGGIRSVEHARSILNSGADKVSINSPALERPELIQEISNEFGSQSLVVGVDSKTEDNTDWVYMYTGDETKTIKSKKSTWEWLAEIQRLGAGEVVLNCMNSDGTGEGFDLRQLNLARRLLQIPLVASGGAKSASHFVDVFTKTSVDGALAAGAFHRNELKIPDLKRNLKDLGIEVRS